jgi:hypothetical protein
LEYVAQENHTGFHSIVRWTKAIGPQGCQGALNLICLPMSERSPTW